MGIILSRVRKKKSTIEVLEKLDKNIKEIEENGENAQRKYKKITKLLLVYTVGLYVLYGVVCCFQFKSSVQGKLLYLVPLAISPLLLYIVRRIISWYFNRLFKKNQIRLNEMKKEKKKILEEVMEKETYKVAKQILEKFSGENMPKPNYSMTLAGPSKTDSELRRRIIPQATAPPKVQNPNNGIWSKSQSNRMVFPSTTPNRSLAAPGPPALQLPAPILPLNRSYVDRVVEYLIGDGPNNRYALICSQCHSHNGMALKEEFEYIGFICCYCRFFNPARKIKPEAPKLDVSLKSKESDTDSEKTSGENSEEELKDPSDEKTPGFLDEDSVALNDENTKTISAAERKDIETLKDESKFDPHTGSSEDTELRISSEELINSIQPESEADCDESLVKS